MTRLTPTEQIAPADRRAPRRAEMRQQAPARIHFDSVREIRRWSIAIQRSTAERMTMPPAGGPSLAEREMLVEWLRCGAP